MKVSYLSNTVKMPLMRPPKIKKTSLKAYLTGSKLNRPSFPTPDNPSYKAPHMELPKSDRQKHHRTDRKVVCM